MEKCLGTLPLLNYDGRRSGRVCVAGRAFLMGTLLRGWRLWIGARNNYFARFNEGLINTTPSVENSFEVAGLLPLSLAPEPWTSIQRPSGHTYLGPWMSRRCGLSSFDGLC